MRCKFGCVFPARRKELGGEPSSIGRRNVRNGDALTQRRARAQKREKMRTDVVASSRTARMTPSFGWIALEQVTENPAKLLWYNKTFGTFVG